MRVSAISRPSSASRLRAGAWLCWCLAGGGWLAPGPFDAVAANVPLESPTKAPEHQVKATWMLNFTRFVEWPKSAFATGDSPCVVGVFGKEPFGPAIDAVFSKKTLKGRPFEIRRVARESELAGLHILFVPVSERRAARDALSRIGKAPVLTVGEFENFHEHGGIINFVIKDDSIEFDIDLRHAQKAGLRIDANLLKIARKVRGKYE